jgi:hypothetical protein
VRLLRKWRCEVFRRNVGIEVKEYKGKTRIVRYEEPGASDLWGFLPDRRHFECEVKRFGERPTFNQIEWLRRVNHSLSPAFWVDSIEVLERNLPHIIDGASVRYRLEVQTYKVRGKPRVSICGDWDLILRKT